MSFPADELLSAFHDGELTAVERRVVDEWLAGSPEARRELSEIRQVSELLKALPRPSLPPEFPQQVLQGLEREMLIPSPPADAAGTRVDIGREVDPPARSRRWMHVAAVLTSAAGLLLLVRVLDDRDGRGSVDVARLAEPLKYAATPNLRMADAVSVEQEDRLSLSSELARSETRAEKLAGGSAGQNSVSGSSADGSTFARRGGAATAAEGLYFDQYALQSAEIGEVIQALETNGDEVAVVWLTVVDRHKGLHDLKLLLAKNRIEPADREEFALKAKSVTTKPDAKTASSDAPPPDSDQMHAVLVTSGIQEVTRALAELRQEAFLQSLEVDRPIPLAQLDDVSGLRSLSAEGGAEALVDRRDATVKKVVPAEPEAKSSRLAVSRAERLAVPRAESVAKKPSSAITPSSPTASHAARSNPSLNAKDQPAKQITLQLPMTALAQPHSPAGPPARPRGSAGSVFRSQVAADKNTEKDVTEHRPLQVLFVVVDESQVGRAAAPGTAPRGAPPAKRKSEPKKPAGQDGAA